MKFIAVCLFACLAVSQAAFTSNLVKQAQPSLAQAMFKVRLAVSTGKTNNGFQTEIVAALEQEANNMLTMIQSFIDSAQETAQNLQSSVSDFINQAAALGTVSIQNIQEIIGSFANGIWSSIFGNSNQRFLSSIVNWISEFDLSDTLNAGMDYLAGVINNIDLGSLIQLALGSVVPQPIANLIWNAVSALANSNNKGFWSDMWNSVSNGASTAWSQVANAAGNIVNIASDAFASFQSVVAQFADLAWNEVTFISASAAQQFLDFLRPFQQDLGIMYEQTVAQLMQIISFGTK